MLSVIAAAIVHISNIAHENSRNGRPRPNDLDGLRFQQILAERSCPAHEDYAAKVACILTKSSHAITAASHWDQSGHLNGAEFILQFDKSTRLPRAEIPSHIRQVGPAFLQAADTAPMRAQAGTQPVQAEQTDDRIRVTDTDKPSGETS